MWKETRNEARNLGNIFSKCCGTPSDWMVLICWFFFLFHIVVFIDGNTPLYEPSLSRHLDCTPKNAPLIFRNFAFEKMENRYSSPILIFRIMGNFRTRKTSGTKEIQDIGMRSSYPFNHLRWEMSPFVAQSQLANPSFNTLLEGQKGVSSGSVPQWKRLFTLTPTIEIP